MTTTLRQKLESELLEVEWSAIRPHLARDVVITVSPELDLLDVGVSVASDAKEQVARWVDQRLLSKPTPDELALWESQLERKFRFLIVAPFVLIQHASH